MAFIASELFITSSWFLFKASQRDRVKRAAIIEKHTLLEIQTFFPSLLIQVWRKARAWGFNRDLSWLLPALGCVHWRWLRCSLGTTLWVPPHTYTHTLSGLLPPNPITENKKQLIWEATCRFCDVGFQDRTECKLFVGVQPTQNTNSCNIQHVNWVGFVPSWGPGCRLQQRDVCHNWEGIGEERWAVGRGGNWRVENQQQSGQEVRAALAWWHCEGGPQAGGPGAAVLRRQEKLRAFCQWAALRQGGVPAGRPNHVNPLCHYKNTKWDKALTHRRWRRLGGVSFKQ